MTKRQIVEQIGPPAAADIPFTPNHATGYTWVASFETPLRYQRFELRLSFNSASDDDEVTAVGMDTTDYQGFELMLYRIMRIFSIFSS